MNVYANISPTSDAFDYAKGAFIKTIELVFGGMLRSQREMSQLAQLDRRGLSDVGYARVDFEGEHGDAIQRALIKIYEW